ncbi:MAG: gliding motility protein GldM [Bernardetiaceae bacterium]
MAGGGGPRQRMVNMMYLVLTALLALQVSNSVLEKFYYIDESLEQAQQLTGKDSDQKVGNIKGTVEKNGNRAQEVAVMEKAIAAQKRANEMITYVNEIRSHIIETMGGKNEEGKYEKDKDYDQINNIMLGVEGSKNGKGYELKDALNKYVKDMKTYLPDTLQKVLDEYDPLAVDAKDDPRYMNDPNQKMKDWAYLNFDHTPMVAALAVLNQIKNNIRVVESKTIEVLGSQLGLQDIKFDQIIGRVSPDSRIIPAGTRYTAEMFIAASSSNMSPKMTATIGTVKVNEAGVGIVESAPVPPAAGGPGGREERSWKGTITIPTAFGDTTITFDEKYTVVNPQIKIKSDVAVSLYFKCGNTLQVEVPELGAEYNPTFTGTGGQIIPGSTKGAVTLVPDGKEMTLTVSSGGNKIGTEGPFKVRLVPKPEVKILGPNKKPLDELRGGPMPRAVTAAAIPDEQFRALLPQDARYRVTGGQVTLARGRRAMGTVPINGANINLSGLAAQAAVGDRLVFEIKGVQRQNFQNQVENVNVGNVIVQYPITQ